MLHTPHLGRPKSPLPFPKARGDRLPPTRRRSRGNATTASAQGTKLATATRSGLRSSRRLSSSNLLMLLHLRFLALLFCLESLQAVPMQQVPVLLTPWRLLTLSGMQTLGPHLIS